MLTRAELEYMTRMPNEIHRLSKSINNLVEILKPISEACKNHPECSIEPIEYKIASAQYAYLLNKCIDSDNYKGEFNTDKEKIYLVLANYKSWLKNNQKPITWTTAQHIGDWLRGLPSCCRVAYCNNEIVSIGQSWGIPLQTDMEQENFADQWWTICGHGLLEIAYKLKILLYKIRPYDNERTIQEQMAEAGV